jgi:16S rRNA (guanine966-N2)-methyltransferase
MRIIAGTLKGRRLETPHWEGLRPTSDRLRETLFDILAPRLAGARVLDAYAGTGAVGIEALSRGAATVTFVEQDRRAQRLIAANLARCGIGNACAIIRADVVDALDRIARTTGGDRYDIVLLDPPYVAPVDRPLEAAAGVMATGAVLVLEHAKRRPAPAAAGPLVRTREVAAGDSALSFYQRR